MSSSRRENPHAPGAAESSPTITKELLARYRAGDFEAERRLFERFRGRLVELARKHPRMRPIERHTAVDDVVQEVFWRVLSAGALTTFEDRGRGSLENLLHTVLERTLIDLARRAGARKRGGDAEQRALDNQGDGPRALDDIASNDTTPTSHASGRDLVARAKSLLTEREWEAWELVEIQGLSSEEAAQRLALSASAVRGVLLRARMKLASALSRERRDSGSRSGP